ncbi:uncharacterized protein [Diabrotica undecimpunctata]|uniref:uncharacterized protein n=1 Tax=Diabrotica undecimpunctata TaxID=50387 RepID=UPI003B63BD91
MARKQKTNVKLTAEVQKRCLRSSCNINNNNATIPTSKNVRKPAKRQLVKDISPILPEITIPTKTLTAVVQKQKTDPTDQIIPNDEQEQVRTKPIIAVIPTIELNLQKQKTDPTDPFFLTDEQIPVTTESVIAVVEEHKMDTSVPVVTAVEQQTIEAQEYVYLNGCQVFTTYRHKKFDNLQRKSYFSKKCWFAYSRLQLSLKV